MRIETGTFSVNSDTFGWELHRGSGDRIFDGRISFGQRFTTTPHVIIGITHLDGSGSAVRVDTQVINVDDDGFTVRFFTWLDSTLWGVAISWLAHGD